jgi:hypothetical protein
MNEKINEWLKILMMNDEWFRLSIKFIEDEWFRLLWDERWKKDERWMIQDEFITRWNILWYCDFTQQWNDSITMKDYHITIIICWMNYYACKCPMLIYCMIRKMRWDEMRRKMKSSDILWWDARWKILWYMMRWMMRYFYGTW